jgi:hypothetical protein
VEAPTRRRLLARGKRPQSDVPEKRPRRPLVARTVTPPNTGTGGAARGLLAAARAEPVPVLPVEPSVQKTVQKTVETPVETLVATPAPSAPAMEMPAVYTFAPRKSARRFLSLMLIAALIAAGSLGYSAYQSRDTNEIGIAAIATVVAMVIWAIRAGATVTRLTVRRGQLEITRQGGRAVFDLASTYTSIQVVGKPGSKKWKVHLVHSGTPTVVIDSTMVDGRDFMRVIRFFRPEVG